jgi:iron complex outermembrane receptor protein
VNTDGYGLVASYSHQQGLVASYSHQQQEQLKASERDFAKTGFIFFDYGGETMYFQNSSANAVPGNAYIYTAGREIRSFNPDALSTGTCATQTTPDGETCRFDYTSTLEILPETERDTITLNGKFKFTDNLAGFGTVLWSNYKMTARIAPYPTGEIPLWLSSQTMSDLVATEVWPYLTPEEQAAVDEITGTWRAVPAGNRTTEYDTDALNIVLGVEGNTSRIDYESAFTHAITDRRGPGGPGADCLSRSLGREQDHHECL